MHIVKKNSTLQVFVEFFSKSELWTLVDNILSMCSQCLPASALLLKVPDDKNDDDDDGDDDDDDEDGADDDDVDNHDGVDVDPRLSAQVQLSKTRIAPGTF